MPDKVTINIKKGKATIVEGKDTFVGKLLAAKGKIKINSPRVHQELNIKPE